jgi:hypothetical protein
MGDGTSQSGNWGCTGCGCLGFLAVVVFFVVILALLG